MKYLVQFNQLSTNEKALVRKATMPHWHENRIRTER